MWFFCCDAIKTYLDAVRARPPGGRCLTGAENTVAAASEPPLAVAEVVEDEETPKRLASSLMRVKGKVRVFRPRTCIISQPLTRFRNNRMGVKRLGELTAALPCSRGIPSSKWNAKR